MVGPQYYTSEECSSAGSIETNFEEPEAAQHVQLLHMHMKMKMQMEWPRGEIPYICGNSPLLPGTSTRARPYSSDDES